ncbi:MAG: GAF domain-containing protein, partial [Gammaproteobacteria bacterium]|nr:GAF domain-containing protein [Gammaproteobacteria bacterium]
MSSSTQLSRSLEALRLRLTSVNRAWTVDNHKALLTFFVNVVPRILEAERCGVFIRDPGTGRIVSQVGTEIGEADLEPPMEGSVVGRAISTGRSVVVNDMSEQSGFHRTAEELTGFTTRNLVCAPIKSVTGGSVTGAIEVLNKRGGREFDDGDVATVEEVAHYLAMALENVLLNKEILKLSGELDREVSQFRSSYLGDVPFIAESESMRGVLDVVGMVSQTPVSVVIYGEN